MNANDSFNFKSTAPPHLGVQVRWMINLKPARTTIQRLRMNYNIDASCVFSLIANQRGEKNERVTVNQEIPFT